MFALEAIKTIKDFNRLLAFKYIIAYYTSSHFSQRFQDEGTDQRKKKRHYFPSLVIKSMV